MRFYSAEDIENLAAQGKKELVLDADIALTDLARDTARQLGITLVYGSRPTPVPAITTPAPARAAPAPTPQVETKPKGCQHAPLTSSNPAPVLATDNAPSPLVDRLVGMVKQIGKRSGNGQGA